MGTVETLVALLSASATVFACLGSLLWWTYRRGQASGAEKAKRQADQRAQEQVDEKIQELERLVAEMRLELASMQKRRRLGPSSRHAYGCHPSGSSRPFTRADNAAAISGGTGTFDPSNPRNGRNDPSEASASSSVRSNGGCTR